MSFDKSMKNIYYDGIEKAIDQVGYKVISVDMEEYNSKICDRIISYIKRCKFSICDFAGYKVEYTLKLIMQWG